MSDDAITKLVDGMTLEDAESYVEERIVSGASSFVEAWQLIDRIHDTGIWTMKVMADGSSPRTFEQYLNDLVDSVRDRYPHLPISKSTVHSKLRWLKRGRQLGLPDAAVVNAPPSALNRLQSMAKWDKKTGELLEVKDTVDVEMLPGLPDQDVKTRFQFLVSDVVNANSPTDAHEAIDCVMHDHSEDFDYIIVKWHNKLTSHKVRWTRIVDGEIVGAKTYDLMRDELPDEVIADYCRRLDCWPNERDITQQNGNP